VHRPANKRIEQAIGSNVTCDKGKLLDIQNIKRNNMNMNYKIRITCKMKIRIWGLSVCTITSWTILIWHSTHPTPGHHSTPMHVWHRDTPNPNSVCLCFIDQEARAKTQSHSSKSFHSCLLTMTQEKTNSARHHSTPMYVRHQDTPNPNSVHAS
jgi:hypothetical protein